MSSVIEVPDGRKAKWLGAWLRERVFRGLWWLVPLALMIALGGGTKTWFVRACVASIALVVLRFWDDVEDLVHDRVWHPERVLCTVPLRQAYVWCVAGMGLAGVLVAAAGPWGLMFVAALPVLYLAKRIRRESRDEFRVVWAHVILLKVPALMMALRPLVISPGDGWENACALFGFVGAYEVFHDAEVKRSAWAPIMLLMDIFFLLLGLAVNIMQEIGND